MKQNLIINLIPFTLDFEEVKIFYTENKPNIEGHIFKFYDENKTSKLIYWNTDQFLNSKPMKIHKNDKGRVKLFNRASRKLIKKTLKEYFQNKNLIINDDFIGNITVLEKMENSSTQDLIQHKKFNIRIVPPFEQFICYEGKIWCLNISYNGQVSITRKPLNKYSNHSSITKVVINNTVKHIKELNEQERNSTETKIIVNNEFRRQQGGELNFDTSKNKNKNKYNDFYKETLQFYKTYLKGKDIPINESHYKISISNSGFQKINENNIIHPKKHSNLLLFSENKTHFNPYYGLKEYGPYRSNVNKYKFFFIFHKEDRELANNLYNYLTKGMKGFPGLFQFVGLELELFLDKDKTITFEKADPIGEIESQLKNLNFEENIQHLAIYISRISKDDSDDNRKKIYYKLKKILLEKNITSQVIDKKSILKHDFKYFLPNIGVAILSKLKGIPWRLKRPVKYDLIIGVGAFRKKENTYIGTTMTFKNDGTFVQFKTSQSNSPQNIANFLRSIITDVSNLSREQPIKRIVIHYYKQMSSKESKVIERTLNELNLKTPYIVLYITEQPHCIPFDDNYDGRMPVSGTCIVERDKEAYILCNNERYENTVGARITKYPFPIQIKISKSSKEKLAKKDVEILIDQIYQFSRMYWKSVKQKEEPVTTLYSKMIAEFTAFFDEQSLPDADIAQKTLWFL